MHRNIYFSNLILELETLLNVCEPPHELYQQLKMEKGGKKESLKIPSPQYNCSQTFEKFALDPASGSCGMVGVNVAMIS